MSRCISSHTPFLSHCLHQYFKTALHLIFTVPKLYLHLTSYIPSTLPFHPLHHLFPSFPFSSDAYALAKAGLAPLETVVEILRALQGEETSIVWGAIAGVLGGLHLLMEQMGELLCCCMGLVIILCMCNVICWSFEGQSLCPIVLTCRY